MTQMIQKTPEQLKTLEHLLQQEIHVYQQIENTMGQKKDAIIANDASRLMGIDQILLGYSQRLEALEVERNTLMAQMGLEGQRLKNLCDVLEPPLAKPFIEAREQLVRCVSNIQQLNQNNRDLLSLSLQWIADSVQVIADALMPESASYNAQGTHPKKRHDKGNKMIQSTIEHSA